MKASEPAPVGRLAPSPTGLLHLGHARTFVLAWWHLRANGGRCLLRIEDLDAERSRPEFEEAILRDLEWLGLDLDGPLQRQSEFAEAHTSALDRLFEEGRVYPCICTRAELRAVQSAPQAGDAPCDRYPGTCRDRFTSLDEARVAAKGREPALRYRIPESRAPVEFEDGIAGPFRQDVGAVVGDFLVSQRRPGAAAYQLAVVLDDARQGVSWVHRGDDLLDSTPRQILLQRALGLPIPRAWFHFPLVVDDQGRRLAKRHDALSLQALREAGVDPRALLAWVARSAGQDLPQGTLPGAEELASLPFLLDRLPGTAARFGAEERAGLAPASR